MKLFTTLGLAICSFPGMIEAASVSARNETEGMTYVGPITPGGANFTLWGDATSIYNQILELNPAFNPDDFDIIKEAKAKRGFELEKRTQTNGCCGCPNPISTNSCNAANTLVNANTLYQLPGSCYTTAGVPYNRMACNGDAGAYISSPNGGAHGDTCASAGLYVLQVVQSCGSFYDLTYVNVQGQICDTGGYCVIVTSC